MTIEGLMAQIGSIITHTPPGEPQFDEAIMGAECVLALVHRMKVTDRDLYPG